MILNSKRSKVPSIIFTTCTPVADSRCTNGLVPISRVSFMALPSELIKAVVVLATCRAGVSLDGSKTDGCGGWPLHFWCPDLGKRDVQFTLVLCVVILSDYGRCQVNISQEIVVSRS